MSELVELIKRIGIFMIAAQAVLHFAPGQKYEKYIKLIVGVLVLLQFVSPLGGILGRAETDLGGKFWEMEELFYEDGAMGGLDSPPTAADVMIESLENEIKSRLNAEIAEEGYLVSDVQIRMKTIEEKECRQYVLEHMRVVVYRKAAGNSQTAGTGIEKIQIEKIDVDMGGNDDREEAAEEGENRLFYGEAEELAERLRKRFGEILDMDAEDMEVSVYGADEETGR